ncbi:MAG: hypothetical protein ACM309_09690 [Bacillota bacterium]
MARPAKYLPVGTRVRVTARLRPVKECGEGGEPLSKTWEPVPDDFIGTIIAVVRVYHYDYMKRTEEPEITYLVARDLHRRARVRPGDMTPLEPVAPVQALRDELIEFAGEVWVQWGLVYSDGRRDAGCLSTLEHARDILRRYGRIDERGRFAWEEVKNGDRGTGNRVADSPGAPCEA